MIDNALKLDGAFVNCQLTRTVRIDQDHEVDLTALSIAAADDGTLHVQVVDQQVGVLLLGDGHGRSQDHDRGHQRPTRVHVEADSPNVDVDIPWYC